jgi:hypothetical protein
VFLNTSALYWKLLNCTSARHGIIKMSNVIDANSGSGDEHIHPAFNLSFLIFVWNQIANSRFLLSETLNLHLEVSYILSLLTVFSEITSAVNLVPWKGAVNTKSRFPLGRMSSNPF